MGLKTSFTSLQRMSSWVPKGNDMNKAAIAALLLMVAIVIVPSGCVTTSSPASPIPSKAPEPQSGSFEFEVGNSLYPKSRGASIGFQRYLSAGEEVTGTFEWKGNDSIRYKWSLYVYAPDGSTMLRWSGADLKHDFRFTPTMSGTYKIELASQKGFPCQVRLIDSSPPPRLERVGARTS